MGWEVDRSIAMLASRGTIIVESLVELGVPVSTEESGYR